MKKLLVLALLCVATISAQAQKATNDEQKAVLKEFLAKYDANKDGKLDKDEKAKFTAEDKAKWQKAFPKKSKKAATDTAGATTGDAKPATPAAPATGTTGN